LALASELRLLARANLEGSLAPRARRYRQFRHISRPGRT